MLSYQHAYHAGNLADVHKHAILSWVLDRMCQKDKPLTYIETHAGRGLYDLGGAEATKTGEAARGISRVSDWFDAEHPYTRARAWLDEWRKPGLYPGSPLIAEALLRPDDTMHLAELHPTEHAALLTNSHHPDRRVHRQDGMELALSLAPPTPRRGLMLIDPAYEVKAEYDTIPRALAQVAKAWNVGVLMLWYPILTDDRQAPMVARLRDDHASALIHEVRFAPARPGHGMIGSGMCVVNPPWGLSDEVTRLSQNYAQLSK